LSRSAYKDLVVELLRTLVETYSPTFDEAEAVEKLRRFTEDKLSYDEVVVDEVGNLIASFGSGDRSVALVGHIDTVPGYLRVSSEGGVIRGRGAVDAKGPLAAAFVGASLARELVGSDNLKVYAIALVGEEGPSHGAWHLVRSGFSADYVVICEPSGTVDVVIEYRGSAALTIKCWSKGGHTSGPHASESACDSLISVWEMLSSEFSGSSASEFSAALTKLSCGDGGPVLPKSGVMRVNIRVPYGVSYDEFSKLISELRIPRNCCVILESFTGPVRASVNTAVVRALYRALIKQGLRPRLARKLGTSDMNILYGRVSTEVAAYGPGDPALSHTDEEFITVDDLVRGMLTYANVIKELSELSRRT